MYYSGSKEKKAFGVLAVIPQGASTNATQAAVSLITGEDSNRIGLTGFAAALRRIYYFVENGGITAKKRVIGALIRIVTAMIPMIPLV